MTTNMLRGLLGLLVLLCCSEASAQVTCAHSTSQPTPLIGETFTTSVTIARPSGATAFAPAIEVMVPPRLTLTAASALGQTLSVQSIGTFPGTTTGTLTNPLTTEVVTGPSTFQFALVRFPLSGLAPAAGPQTMTLTFSVGPTAVVGTALQPQVTCLFAFGADALNNPGTDTPIRSDVRTTGTDQSATTVTPSLARLTKTVSPAPSASGSSYPITWVLALDVATGRTITGGELRDTIPSSFQITGITASAGGVVNTPSTIPTTPGGSLQVTFASITGTAAAVDASVQVTGFVPLNDASSAAVLSQTCASGSTATLLNAGSFANGTSSGSPVPVLNASATLQARAELIRESIVNLAPGAPADFRPGESGQISLTVNASDFFTLNSAGVQSVLGAGLRYTGNATVDGVPAMPTVSVDSRTVTFTLGNLPASARRTITYTFIVDETYSAVPTDRVLGGDVLGTTHTLSSVVPPANCPLTSTEANGGADASVRIGRVTLTKTLLAINGLAPVGAPRVRPGDVVTWRIDLYQRAGDQAGITIVDSLPRPLFDARQHGAAPAFPSAAFRIGAGSTLPNGTAVTVSTTTASTDNTVTFTIGAFETQPTNEVRVVLDFDFTVTNDPREDGLVFTNLATATLSSSGATTVTSTTVSSFTDSNPALFLTKGAVSVSSSVGGPAKPGVTFAPSTINAGPWSSTNLATTPVQNTVSGVDANDAIIFRVIAENRGSTAAFDVQLFDTPPAQLTCNSSALTVTNGAGAALAFTPVALPGGFGARLSAALPARHPTDGTNIAVLTVTCTVNATGGVPNGLVTNSARIDSYSSTLGGPNFVPANYTPTIGSTTARIANIGLAKTRTDALEPTIRDTTAYSVTATFPEGQFTNVVLTDAFPTALAFVTNVGPVLMLPSGVTATGSTTGVVSADGRTITWSLGDVTNSNSNDAAEVTTALPLTAVVLNVAGATAGSTAVNQMRASVGGSQVNSSNASAVTLRQAAITFSQSVSPNPVAGGATPTVTATLASSSGATNRTAHDVVYTFTAPANCTNPTGVSLMGVMGTTNVTGNVVTVSMPAVMPGQTATITFNCAVPTNVLIGSTVTLPGTVTYTTQPGTPAQLGPNANAVERTISAAQNTTLTISPLSATKVRVGSGTVTVGEVVDFVVTTSVPVGTTGVSVTLTDTMAAGLVFASTSDFTAAAGLSCNGGACTLPMPTVTNGGRDVSWALGTVTNGAATSQDLSFTVRTIVDNVSAAVRSASLSNTFAAGAQTSPAAAVVVAEPAVSFTVSAAPASGNAGDIFTVTFGVTNNNATSTNVSTAFEATFGLTLPPGLDVVAGSYASATCPAPTSQSLMGTSPTLTFGTLPPATNCTFTLQLRMNDSVTLGTALVSGASAAWSSRPGVVTTPQSTFSATSTERTGNSMNPGGALNTYSQTRSFSLNASATASVVKTLVSSNSTTTSDPNLAVGEDVTYRLRVTVGEGITPTVTVVDTPPASMQLISVTLDTMGFAGMVMTNPTNPSLGLAAGTLGTFTLGAVSNPGDNNATNDSFSLVVVARTVMGATVGNPGQTNQARLSSGATALATGSVPVTIVLPRLRLTQTLTTTTPTPGASVQGASVLTNQGTGPACDTSVSVTAPTGFTIANPGTDGLDNDQNGLTDEAAEAGFLSGNVLTIPVTSCLDAAATRSLPWRMTVSTTVAPTAVSIASDLGNLRTLPNPTGVSLTPTSDLFDNNGNGQTDEATDGRVSTSVTPAAPRLVFTKTFTDLNAGTLQPGDTMEWVISVQNTGTGQSTGLTLTDVLPTMNAVIVTGSATTSQGTVSVMGSTLTAPLGNLAAGATATVRVRLTISGVLTSAVQFSNQAQLGTTDAYGPRVSDDPSTAATDDATVATVSTSVQTPLITSPANGSRTNDDTPLVTGTSAPNATVTVFFDGSTTPACTAMADASGAWSCTPTMGLTMGQHTVAARATDGSGGVSFFSPTNTFTVDTSPPSVAITTPANGSVLAMSPATISGTTEANATVQVFVDGSTTALCTVTADSTGAWSCPVTMALSDGPHSVSAVATDAARNVSQRATNHFSIDTTPPVAPTITGPVENATTNPTPTFSGTAEPGSTVKLFVDGSTTPACETTADAQGRYACVSTQTLTPGPHEVVARSEDAAGNQASSPTRRFTVAMDAVSGPPVITGPRRNERLADTTPTFSGTATPNSMVRVFVDGGTTPVCTATADAQGRFSCDAMSPLTEGDHSVTATSTTSAGVSAGSAPVPFSIDTTTPAVPTITSPTANATTNDTPTYTGTAEPNARVEVFVDGGMTPVCTVTADSSGAWACTQPTALTSGAHVVTARATDAAGNSSARTADRPFTVAANQPPTALLTAPTPNQVVTTTTPTFSGTATPGATVRVFIDGSMTPACTAVADATGRFSCVATTALTPGNHGATVTATNANGTSQPGMAVPFVIDTTAPSAPVVTTPADGSTTNTQPTFSGTAEPNSTVTVRVDGYVQCVVQASATGTWSCAAAQPLAPGAHVVNATAQDAAGNTSPTSNTNRFTVFGSPRMPTLDTPANGSVTAMRRPTFRGQAEPNASVEVVVDGVTVCTTQADAMGRFECAPSSDLTLGQHMAVARTMTPGGMSSTNTNTFTVKDLPTTPVLESPADGDTVKTTTPTFTGRAEPGSMVNVSVDGTSVCTATADAQGRFECAASEPLAPGNHTVSVQSTNSAGTTSSPTSGFVIDTRDLDGDGIDDSIGLRGGGCNQLPGSSLLALLALIALRLRLSASLERTNR